MKKKRNNKLPLQVLVVLVLLVLALVSEGLMLWTWFHILEPQLHEKAEITARALAHSRISILSSTLASQNGPGNPGKVLEAMDSLMLITDPVTERSVILGMELEIDYDVVHVPVGSLDLKRGNVQCPDCFMTEIALYAPRTKELLGLARFYNSSEFYRVFIADVRSRLLGISGLVIALFIVATIFLAYLFKKSSAIEKELREQQAQLIHAGRIAAMGEMATGIAHEINQPLAIIHLAAGGLHRYFKMRGQGGMEAKAAEKIVRQVERCVKIIDNMRSFVRKSPHGNNLIRLDQALERALSFFREQFRVHDVHLEVRVDKGEFRARINEQKFEQIVVNLLSNARYAVEKKVETGGDGFEKKIRVRLSRCGSDPSFILFEVCDNGLGMSPEEKRRCLEPFYTTKEVGEGTGLGLSIVHTIVRELDNASIEVESRQGGGSCFRIRLPGEREGKDGNEDFAG